jgi:hypothetical protein
MINPTTVIEEILSLFTKIILVNKYVIEKKYLTEENVYVNEFAFKQIMTSVLANILKGLKKQGGLYIEISKDKSKYISITLRKKGVSYNLENMDNISIFGGKHIPLKGIELNWQLIERLMKLQNGSLTREQPLEDNETIILKFPTKLKAPRKKATKDLGNNVIKFKK